MVLDFNSIESVNPNDIQKGYGLLRGSLNIMWDITNRCNLRCMHCYNGSGQAPNYADLTDDQMRMVADEIIDMKIPIVCFCGGEPTLRLPLILELAKRFSKENIVVNMVSNELLLNDDNIKDLRQSGVTDVQISLDSYCPEIHDKFRGVVGAHSHALAAIKLLIKNGIVPEVTFIPTQINFKDIGNLIDLLNSLGLKKVRSMPFVPIGRGFPNRDSLKLNRSQLWEFFWLVQQGIANHPDFTFDYGDPLEHIYLFSKNKIARTVTFEIRSNGDIVISPYLPYIYGNVIKTSLSDLWNDGLKDVWRTPDIQEVAHKIISLDDLEAQSSMPWSGHDVEIKHN